MPTPFSIAMALLVCLSFHVATAGAASTPSPPPKSDSRSERFQCRMIIESLSHPYWYEAQGNPAAAKGFWDRTQWEQRLAADASNGYNYILYSCDPWLVHQWQTWLIRHRKYPEARCLETEQQEAIIKHVTWIFNKAHDLGLKNVLMNMCIVTTPEFAKAHGMDQDMPVSETVDWRHNYQHVIPGGQSYDKMVHWGVRNQLTRDFTAASIAELFQTYPALDGLLGTMGEALPGKRSSWFAEAIVPGLKASGRKPLYIIFHWMMPLEDFLDDIVRPKVYDNLWLAIEHNGEIISDTVPYPISVRWTREAGIPTIVQYVAHNISHLPFNSPKWAYAMVHETARLDNTIGFAYYVVGGALQSPNYDLFGKALAYYGAHDEPYSDEPWIKILEQRFGDRDAARHFLNAYNISAGITPGVNQIAWSPHDSRATSQFMLKYWHWTDEDPRYSQFASPAQGATLLPLRYYARVIAKVGDSFRDNNGSEYRCNVGLGGAPGSPGHPGAQELLWGHIDYQVTPEMHMRKIRQMGEECLREAELGLQTVKQNREMAQDLYNQMKAYQLLTGYYAKKVQTAIAALLYSFRHRPEDKAQAEQLADEVVTLYTAAAEHIWENVAKRNKDVKGGWWDEQRDVLGLIEVEKKEREQLSRIFDWPAAESQASTDTARLGTALRTK